MKRVGRELDQLLWAFHEDWTHEFDDPYALAEWYLEGMPGGRLRALMSELEVFVSTHPQMVALLPECQIGARLDGQAEFEAWLAALQGRIEQALAGDDSEPLVAPV